MNIRGGARFSILGGLSPQDFFLGGLRPDLEGLRTDLHRAQVNFTWSSEKNLGGLEPNLGGLSPPSPPFGAATSEHVVTASMREKR